jgi:hypothetical protein
MIYELDFDENLETYIPIKGLKDEVCVSLSDSLYDSKEDLTEQNKTKIINFINNFEKWYNKSITAIINWTKQEYNVTAETNDLTLIHIFILYDQNFDELYGLEFGAEFDIEHGIGIKISGKDFGIVEIGTADVAFC